jgi:hypothetical protein
VTLKTAPGLHGHRAEEADQVIRDIVESVSVPL